MGAPEDRCCSGFSYRSSRKHARLVSVDSRTTPRTGESQAGARRGQIVIVLGEVATSARTLRGAERRGLNA